MKPFSLMAIVFTLVLTLALPASANSSTVSFLGEARVSNQRVTLLDLASAPQQLSAETRAKLASVIVTSAPRLGGRSVINGARLRDLVRQAKLDRGVSTLLPAQVIVRRASRTLTHKELADAFRSALVQRLGSRADQITIRSVDTGTDRTIPAGNLSMDVDFLSDRLLGRVLASVTVRVNGSKITTRRVVGDVEMMGQVVVAARPMQRKQVIELDDLEVISANMAEMATGAVTDPEQIVGLRTRKAVGMGEAIDSRWLEQAPLIRRGDLVTMIARGPGLNVSAKARAEQTGYKDKRIKLTNMATKRTVWGTVLDSGTVVVDF